MTAAPAAPDLADRPAAAAPAQGSHAASPVRAAGTSTGATPRGVWLRSRRALLALLVLVLVAVVTALLGTRSGGQLDPRAYQPGGSRALATLLGQRGVAVHVVGDLPALEAAVRPGSRVLVPLPGDLTTEELGRLGSLDAPLVVTGAGAEQVAALHLPVDVEEADEQVRGPRCDLPAAQVAGPALTGDQAYAPRAGAAATRGCYPSGRAATVLDLTDRRVVLVGSPALLTNDDLDREGDAALALGLLGADRPAPGAQVLWLLPDAGRPVPAGERTLGDLLPDGVRAAALQLLVAVVLLALWRARRLGRVVTEPLPVVVRAAEAVEGRGRLYRAAGARDAASAALRAGARDRLATRLGLGTEPGRPALVPTVAARCGRSPAEVDALLYGAPPVDDAALVRLADALDGLVP